MSKKKTIEEINQYFAKEDYILLATEYINNSTPMEYICPNGHTHAMSWHNFSHGNRCPKCNISKGEKAIENYLIKNAIKYIAQYRFEDCRNLLPLPFDFYVPSLNTCIEYDGIQHFEVRKYFHENEESLKERQRLDNIKTQYCLDNNIKLIRISYLEFNNIETILTQTLNL